MAGLSFDLFDVEESGEEPKFFDIEGEKFTCLPRLPALAFRHLSQGNLLYGARAFDFVMSVLTDEDNEQRFMAVATRKDRLLLPETMARIVSGLIEAYDKKRPTEPSSD